MSRYVDLDLITRKLNENGFYELEKIPTVDAVSVVHHGRWYVYETGHEDTEAKCSICGFETLVNEPGNGLHMVEDLKYCPRCGAKMDALVDAVSVVRCKDCKFLTDGKCFFTTTPKDPDDYCSLGEKVTKCGMKKFFVLSRRSPEYHRIVEAKDISEVADHYYDSCYGIIEIPQDEVTE